MIKGRALNGKSAKIAVPQTAIDGDYETCGNDENGDNWEIISNRRWSRDVLSKPIPTCDTCHMMATVCPMCRTAQGDK